MQDGVIHKDEFAYALFKAQNHSNIFAEKVVHIFSYVLCIYSVTGL